MISTILSIAMLFAPHSYAPITNPDCIPPCAIVQTGMFDPCAVISEARISRSGYTDPTTIPYSELNPLGYQEDGK